MASPYNRRRGTPPPQLYVCRALVRAMGSLLSGVVQQIEGLRGDDAVYDTRVLAQSLRASAFAFRMKFCRLLVTMAYLESNVSFGVQQATLWAHFVARANDIKTPCNEVISLAQELLLRTELSTAQQLLFVENVRFHLGLWKETLGQFLPEFETENGSKSNTEKIVQNISSTVSPIGHTLRAAFYSGTVDGSSHVHVRRRVNDSKTHNPWQHRGSQFVDMESQNDHSAGHSIGRSSCASSTKSSNKSTLSLGSLFSFLRNHLFHQQKNGRHNGLGRQKDDILIGINHTHITLIDPRQHKLLDVYEDPSPGGNMSLNETISLFCNADD
ncbi:hypothetical protein niasHT_014070 [Heterodera trifolii]|uniref:Uncharacterized protein n=1 Tax=Heterodera trifolii TaxID=157864 RepID=A0ABD2LGA7_9BILA